MNKTEVVNFLSQSYHLSFSHFPAQTKFSGRQKDGISEEMTICEKYDERIERTGQGPRTKPKENGEKKKREQHWPHLSTTVVAQRRHLLAVENHLHGRSPPGVWMGDEVRHESTIYRERGCVTSSSTVCLTTNKHGDFHVIICNRSCILHACLRVWEYSLLGVFLVFVYGSLAAHVTCSVGRTLEP